MRRRLERLLRRRAAARSPPGCREPDGGFDRFELGRIAAASTIADGRAAARARRPLRRQPTAASADGADCTRTWRFASNAPDEPPVDAAAGGRSRPPRRRPRRRRRCRPAGRCGGCPGSSPVALGAGHRQHRLARRPSASPGSPSWRVTFHERPAADERRRSASPSAEGALEAAAGFEQTAGGAYVVALADSPLAGRLGGRDTRGRASRVDGGPQGELSLAGSTKALRGALEDCHGF